MKKNNLKLKNWLVLSAIILASAFELVILQDRIMRVSASVEPIAFMGPDADFGVVFPGEIQNKDFFVRATSDYGASIPYSLAVQVKPRQPSDREYCIANPLDHLKCYPLLCNHLDILSAENEGDTKDSATLDPAVDIADSWKVVLNTPPIKNHAARGYAGETVDSEDTYGCDVRLVLKDTPNGEADPPVIKAKWEMNIDKDALTYLGTDDNLLAGAQFLPSGQYEIPKRYAVCAIATDSHGLADIKEVYTDIYYPKDISTGPNHEPNRLGCGQNMGEISLARMPKTEGIELFCNRIQKDNNNLPVFNTLPVAYDYSEICNLDGELWKETAAVYCGETYLSYEDPSGAYKTLAYVQDMNGVNGELGNEFAYMPLTAFETDFTAVDYGSVKLNTHKTISGDSVFQEGDGRSTIRNTGNTRFNVVIMQDDTGLGKTSGVWNIKYDARVGSDAAFTDYLPNENKTVNNALNLSETDEMDFSVDVSHFPFTDKDKYTGVMNLSAVSVPHLACE